MKTRRFTSVTAGLLVALLVLAAVAMAQTVLITDKVGDAPRKSLDIKKVRATRLTSKMKFTIVLAGRANRRNLPVIEFDIDNDRNADWYLTMSENGTSLFNYTKNRVIAPATATVDGAVVTYTVSTRPIRRTHWRASTIPPEGGDFGNADDAPNVNYAKLPS